MVFFQIDPANKLISLQVNNFLGLIIDLIMGNLKALPTMSIIQSVGYTNLVFCFNIQGIG